MFQQQGSRTAGPRSPGPYSPHPLWQVAASHSLGKALHSPLFRRWRWLSWHRPAACAYLHRHGASRKGFQFLRYTRHRATEGPHPHPHPLPLISLSSPSHEVISPAAYSKTNTELCLSPPTNLHAAFEYDTTISGANSLVAFGPLH